MFETVQDIVFRDSEYVTVKVAYQNLTDFIAGLPDFEEYVLGQVFRLLFADVMGDERSDFRCKDNVNLLQCGDVRLRKPFHKIFVVLYLYISVKVLIFEDNIVTIVR